MTDTDNTGATIEAYYGDVVLRSAPRARGASAELPDD
jgi:hypothetical protein